MVHKVPPLGFRTGKTFIWENNTVVKNNSLSFIEGSNFEKLAYEVCYKIGRRKRFYIVRAVEKITSGFSTIFLVLYMPQIKRQAKYFRWGQKKFRIFRFLLRHRKIKLRNYFWKLWNRAIMLEEKIIQFKVRVNRWLSKRMFRGVRLIKELRTRKNHRSKKLGMNTAKKKGADFFANFLAIKNLQNSKALWRKLHPAKSAKKRWELVNFEEKKKLKKKIFLLRRLRRKMTGLRRKRKKKFFKKLLSSKYKKRVKNKRRKLFNGLKFSEKLSKKLSLSLKVKPYNLFLYLLKKKKILFRTHQRYYWVRKYKYQRYFYAHYYDIINAFWVIGLFDNYKILCEIFKVTIPRFSKLKRFLFFLDRVTRAMRCVSKKFKCFKIRWTGKLAGSTKRTKTFMLGYGFTPYQTLNKKVKTLFYSYRHAYGAFGVKFLICYN